MDNFCNNQFFKKKCFFFFKFCMLWYCKNFPKGKLIICYFFSNLPWFYVFVSSNRRKLGIRTTLQRGLFASRAHSDTETTDQSGRASYLGNHRITLRSWRSRGPNRNAEKFSVPQVPQEVLGQEQRHTAHEVRLQSGAEIRLSLLQHAQQMAFQPL